MTYIGQEGTEHFREQMILDLEQYIDRSPIPDRNRGQDKDLTDLVEEIERLNRTLRELTW